MIEESIIQSNFIGRDGFRWWIGQVAPEKAQEDQLNQTAAAWGNRVKVRIMGYHPQNTIELKDEDLPWAQVLLSPQAGSGKANRAKSLRLSPGDSVLGFFLDGDDAQLPVIIGIFGNTAYSSSDEYKGPFTPFTGYTSKIKNDNTYILKNEVGDQSGKKAQKSPRAVSPELAKKIEEATGIAERAVSTAIGQTVVFGSSSGSATISKVKAEVESLVSKIPFSTATQKMAMLSEKVDKISGLASGLVGNMVNSTYKGLAPKLNGGLDKLYTSVYGKVLAATKSRSIAKRAGTAAQTAMVPGIGAIHNFLGCAVKNIVGGLGNAIKGLLQGMMDNVKNFVSCIGDQFVGGLMNQIIGGITKALGPLLGGVSKILGGFSLGGFLRSKAEGLLSIAKIGKCDKPQKNLEEKTNEWIIGKGPKSILGISVDKILDAANTADKMTQSLVGFGQDLSIAGGSLGVFDFLNPSVSVPGFKSPLGECYGGPPLSCAGVKVNIFGSKGKGASAKAILGSIVGEGASATGSLLGIDLTSGGSGYNTPPFIEITDECGQGYGGIARAVIDYDESSPTYQQVTDIYIVSEGENYPIKGPQVTDQLAVDHVIVVNPGQDYDRNDTISDGDGNPYTIYVDDDGRILNVLPPDSAVANVNGIKDLPELTINTKNGYGAILKPQLKPRPPFQGEVKQVIDCVS